MMLSVLKPFPSDHKHGRRQNRSLDCRDFSITPVLLSQEEQLLPLLFSAIPPRKRRKSAPFRVGNSSHCESSVGLESPPEGYRKNVGICLINPEKKVFGARIDSRQNAWQMPQGGMDDDEDPRVAAMMELREETGVVFVEVVAEFPFWLTYDFPPDVREKLAILWGKEWKGQAQRWFLLKFTGKDAEVNLQGDGAEKAELRDWAWMTDDLIERSVEFVRL